MLPAYWPVPAELVHLPATELETAQKMSNVLNYCHGTKPLSASWKKRIIMWKEMLTLKFCF